MLKIDPENSVTGNLRDPGIRALYSSVILNPKIKIYSLNQSDPNLTKYVSWLKSYKTISFDL